MELRRASRKKVKLRVALSGPSGSGKTMSALLMAYGITGDWGKIALIDTEHNSAELYAVSDILCTNEDNTFNVLELQAPYTPERYIQAIETCEQAGVEVIIIDSASHEWSGTGGILEMKDGMSGKSSFNAWGKLTPLHNSFIERILSSSCHVFACFRAKTDYILIDNNGKQVPEKVGMAPVTRDGAEYEFSIWFDLDIKNNAVTSKDRTSLFKGKPDFKISTETGRFLREWAVTGKSLVDMAIEELRSCTDRACTITVYSKYKHLQDNEQFMAAVKEMGEKFPKEQSASEKEASKEKVPSKTTKAAPKKEAKAATIKEAPAVQYANAKQKEEIIRLLNNPVITRQEKTKMLLEINRFDEARAAKAIDKLKVTIEAREQGNEVAA